MTVRVLAFVEGQTEEKFMREIVSPSLAAREVFISATTPGRPRSHGGVPKWASAKKELLRHLKEDTGQVVTTMFDYYGLPSDWPGRSEARRKRRISTKAETIEQAIHEEVCGELGGSFDRARFLPYIQMHEFEALLFSDTVVLGEAVPPPNLHARLDAILQECGEPEGIDDDPETAPSKRICVLVPGYQKAVHGINAAKGIGLATMRERCPHFAQWIGTLEQLDGGQD